MRDALGGRLASQISSPQSAMSWLIEYSSVLLSRYEVGHYGKAACATLRNKKSKVLGLEFGELIQWRRAVRGDRKNNLDTFLPEGVYAGHRMQSGETIVSTKE